MDSEAGTITEITLDPALLTDVAFKRTLEFLYTGVVSLDKESDQLEETLRAAGLFNLPELKMIVENAKSGDEVLNPSIGTWLNDRNSGIAKEMFFNKVNK